MEASFTIPIVFLGALAAVVTAGRGTMRPLSSLPEVRAYLVPTRQGLLTSVSQLPGSTVNRPVIQTR
jgi:hypothetical protein